MTQTFRSRDEQVEALQIKLAGSPIAFGGAAIALEHILEAEARGAAEERGKGADGQEPVAWMRPDELPSQSYPWYETELHLEKSKTYSMPIYARPANVAALEARIAELEEALERLVRTVGCRIDFHDRNGPHLTCADGDFIRMDIFESWSDDLETARAALKREGGV